MFFVWQSHISMTKFQQHINQMISWYLARYIFVICYWYMHMNIKTLICDICDSTFWLTMSSYNLRVNIRLIWCTENNKKQLIMLPTSHPYIKYTVITGMIILSVMPILRKTALYEFKIRGYEIQRLIVNKISYPVVDSSCNNLWGK